MRGVVAGTEHGGSGVVAARVMGVLGRAKVAAAMTSCNDSGGTWRGRGADWEEGAVGTGGSFLGGGVALREELGRWLEEGGGAYGWRHAPEEGRRVAVAAAGRK